MASDPAEPPSSPAATTHSWLTVQPIGLRVRVPEGHSLLEAALAGQLRLPASCRNGTCRTCMCRLVQGQVRYRIEWPGLLAEEKAEGWILPCVALCVGDVTIDAPRAERHA